MLGILIFEVDPSLKYQPRIIAYIFLVTVFFGSVGYGVGKKNLEAWGLTMMIYMYFAYVLHGCLFKHEIIVPYGKDISANVGKPTRMFLIVTSLISMTVSSIVG